MLQFIKNMNEIIFMVDKDRVILARSDMALRVLGARGEESETLRIDDFFSSVFLDAIFSRSHIDDMKDKPITFPVMDCKGKEILLETRFNWYQCDSGEVLFLSCRDVSLYTDIISELTTKEDRYRTIFHESPLGFIHLNSDCYITDCNSAFLSIFGLDRIDVIGASFIEESDLNIYNRFKRAAIDAVMGMSSRHESQFKSNDETREGWVRAAFSPVMSDNQGFLGAIGIVEDITETKRTMEKIEFVSSHDALTGLYNRGACEDAMRTFDKEEYLPLSVIYVDLNCLKLANDAFGHEEGDSLLSAAGAILREKSTVNDAAYRFGGDEFIMLLRNTDFHAASNRVREIADSCAAWERDGFVSPNMALGCATKFFMDQSLAEIVKAAEDEMYANKLQNGKQARSMVLNSLEVQMHGLLNGTVGKRCRRLMMWADWVVGNMKIDCDPDALRLLFRYHEIGILAFPEELDIVKKDPSLDKVAHPMQHMAVGYRIARSIPEIMIAAENILAHHEWWNGLGYPNQLSGNEIPYESRIMSILDAIEGMIVLSATGDVSSLWNAIDSVKSCGGRQYDPFLTDEFIEKLIENPPNFILDMEDSEKCMEKTI
jgi:diguanylate cyclase (GGDEF)-like protein/PAS domain S-box-containing protein